MKLAHLTEAKKKLSKIDAGYEWVLRNGVFQNNGQDKTPKLLWEKYEKGKVKGKDFFDENYDLIQDSLYWTRSNYQNLVITEEFIDYGGEWSININVNAYAPEPPIRLKGATSLRVEGLDLDSLPWWFPEKCSTIGFTACPNLTFKGAGTVVKDCVSFVIFKPKDIGFKGGILSLFKIKNFKTFDYSQESFDRRRNQFVEIMNQGFKTGDVFDCQEQLEANGFKEQAKL